MWIDVDTVIGPISFFTNGDMAVRQGYLWLERPETKTYIIIMEKRMVGSWITACGS